MRILQKTKDGGDKSNVDVYFLCEFKTLFSVCLLKFNKGGREEYHTHAFNAFTWFLSGYLIEENYREDSVTYKRRLLPKITKRDKKCSLTC